MLYLTCTTIPSVDLAHYIVSHAKDWVSVDCGTNAIFAFFFKGRGITIYFNKLKYQFLTIPSVLAGTAVTYKLTWMLEYCVQGTSLVA